jgi:anaerobic selenocysteine-containing dehydrogenase
MTDKLSRRDFLKLAGATGVAATVLTGCGPASRYVTREPYFKMPEYTHNGQSTYYATTCRECPAACGIVVRTHQGRALKVEGNPAQPVNLGKTCARGQATLHGLYNPDRVQDPAKQKARGSGNYEKMDWDAAVGVVADALKGSDPNGVVFLMGLAPDHLSDLVVDLAKAGGFPAPVRYGAPALFESRATLVEAARRALGVGGLPFFDIANADVTVSFGANFLETWLSPVAYTRGFSRSRKGETHRRRGVFVQVEPRLSQTAAKADEWLPAAPGTEGQVALALGRLVYEARGQVVPAAFDGVDVDAVSQAADVPREKLEHVADLLARADAPLAIPGGAMLGQANGLEAAEAVLALDAALGNPGKPGGVMLSPVPPLDDDRHPASLQEMATLVEKMKAGDVQAIFIHGVNPVFELPKALGFENALKSVPLVVSFATFPDETALQADYVFPDHQGLESWGYQRVATGSAQSVLAGAQPVVVPFYNTRATADVLLAAAAKAGGKLAAALPFADEVAFMQSKLEPLVTAAGGSFGAPEINTFMANFQQHGGWWTKDAAPVTPASVTFTRALQVPAPQFPEGELNFLPYLSPVLGEAGANKPWLQEVPDPLTTVTWNSWVEIHPKTAEELGLEDDDVVLITSAAGALEASVYRYPAIRPDTIAMPFGQGHTAYGRYAAGRGSNPADILELLYNEAGDLAFAATKVRVEKTGRKRPLARLESRMGVYGEE